LILSTAFLASSSLWSRTSCGVLGTAWISSSITLLEAVEWLQQASPLVSQLTLLPPMPSRHRVKFFSHCLFDPQSVLRAVGLFLHVSSHCSARTSPEFHFSPSAQLEVSLGPPPFLASRPLWPSPFLLGLDEVEPLLHLLAFVIGWAHPPILQFR
jgi:hypothetical protein